MSLGLLAVFAAGLLTLATPCVLPMIPVYLAMVAGTSSAAMDGQGRSKTVLVGATLFVAGFATVFTLLGMAATTVGAALAAHRPVLLVVAGLFMVVFGLKELSALKLGWLDRTLALPSVKTKYVALNAFGLGLVFALGWTPCVGPILGSVLTFTASHTTNPGQGAVYLFAYALGVGLPLLGFAWLGDRALAPARRFSRHLPVLQRVTGVLLLIGGVATALPAARAALLSPPAHGSTPALAELGQHAARPALLAFHSPSCAVCRKMAPRVAALERDCAGKQMHVVHVNVAQPEGQGDRI
ncbi:MAG: sulfite exporter TauE/SafE family protein [Polyangiaceae bacterium]|nr:sulfite exporter TauE/SafE family protein [Polyangiaceae bacterium]